MGQSRSKRHQKNQEILLLGGGVRMVMMPVQEPPFQKTYYTMSKGNPDANPSDHTYSPVPVILILSKQIGTSTASLIWLMCSNPPHVLLW